MNISKIIRVIFISSFQYQMIPKRLLTFPYFDFFWYKTYFFIFIWHGIAICLRFRSFRSWWFFGRKQRHIGSDSICFAVDHSSLSKVTVLYDRQCKIKRCPQNGLTAYTIVIYVWTSERFCGQSVHGNFRGVVVASVFDSVHRYLTAGTVTL